MSKAIKTTKQFLKAFSINLSLVILGAMVQTQFNILESISSFFKSFS